MDFSIENLGPCHVSSPLALSRKTGDYITNYTSDDERILIHPSLHFLKNLDPSQRESFSFEAAGPREKIYFDPSKIRAAIVTCGGLCPGINDVIRSLVMELWYWYGVHRILGIRYGYRGFLPEFGYEPLDLIPEKVADIHHTGGTILGSSRGNVASTDIVDALERMNLSILFTIGGDGTQKGALAIHEEIRSRGLKIAVVGIPKTIDNDILHVDKTFGFETAVSVGCEAVRGAHTEAQGAYNGIGVVKLMGRDSGFIAAQATLATHDVNFVLVPEMPFELEGENGLFAHLIKRLEKRHHAVLCIAEGAGLELMAEDPAQQRRDASGNLLHADIGVFLCDRIKEDLHKSGVEFSLKYIDPSYMIRSSPAIASDSVYGATLGQNAVHAAMAGKSGMIVGRWNGVYTHVPMKAIITGRKKIDPESLFWLHVLASTGQPLTMLNPKTAA